MENNNDNIENSNWNQRVDSNQGQFVQNTPNAKGSLVLGIIALCISTVCCFCYGSLAGLILSIIGLFMGISAKKKYNANPGAYTPASFKKAKTGTILNIIALIISILISGILLTIVYLGLTHQLPPELQDSFDDNMRKYDFD